MIKKQKQILRKNNTIQFSGDTVWSKVGSYVVNSNVKKCAVCFKYISWIMHPSST